MAEQAYEKAVEDILNDCESRGKCFMAFRSNLNPVMDEIVSEYLKEQEQIKQ